MVKLQELDRWVRQRWKDKCLSTFPWKLASLIAVITAGPLHGNEWLERQMERLLHNPEINHCTKAPRKETKPKQSKASTMLTKVPT